MKLQCVDCGLKAEMDEMREHVQTVHGRAMRLSEEEYARPTLGGYYASRLLLEPELIQAA